jgi:hypothetical protein
MTPKQERRIQELPALIACEPNTWKMARLVAESERLWALKLNEMTPPWKSSRQQAGSDQIEPVAPNSGYF